MSELSTLPDRLTGPPGVEVTVSVAPLVLPAASCAVTVIWFAPCANVMLATLQTPVPLALPFVPFPRLLQVTLATPTLSDAVPLSDTVLLVVEKLPEAVGELRDTGGAVVSVGFGL